MRYLLIEWMDNKKLVIPADKIYDIHCSDRALMVYHKTEDGKCGDPEVYPLVNIRVYKYITREEYKARLY